jgi:hypothetical protein
MTSPLRYYIGGGNIAAVLNLSPFQTPLDAYHGIIGDAPELDREVEEFFARRKSLEPYAATLLQQRGFEIVGLNNRYTDEHFPHFKSEIDAETRATDGIIDNGEFKTVHPLAVKHQGWGIDGDPEGCPVYVAAQCGWGLGITKRRRCRAFAVVGFELDALYPLARDEDVIGWMRAEANTYWERHVLPRVPPPPTTVADILTYIPANPLKSIEATDDPDLMRTLTAFIEARQSTKEADDYTESLKVKLQLTMNDATAITIRGKPAITWKRNKPSQTVDKEAVIKHLLPLARKTDAEAADSVVACFTKEKDGNRPFLVK